MVAADNFESWLMDIQVLDDNPIYKGQTYRLKFVFSMSYPIGMVYRFCLIFKLSHVLTEALFLAAEAPEVTFVLDGGRNIPMHPHIYSNGIICLDLLDKSGWSPVHNVESVCMSLQSMLASNDKNERPPGDADFVRMNRQRPRDINFYFHDDQV